MNVLTKLGRRIMKRLQATIKTNASALSQSKSMLPRGSEDLYHYTTMNGLKGIIENGCIHATNVRYLNDSQELYFGLNYLKNLIDSSNAAPSEENLPLIDHLIRRRIKYVLISLMNSTSFSSRYFVTSFSGNPDLLSQWRAYGKENLGYCIKFDSVHLQYPVNQMITPLICKVTYVDPADSKEGLKLFDEIIQSIKKIDEGNDSWSSILFQTMPWLEKNNQEEYKKMLWRLDKLDESYGDFINENRIKETDIFSESVDINDEDPAWYTAICTIDIWCISPRLSSVAVWWKHSSFKEEDEHRMVYEYDDSIASLINLEKKIKVGKSFFIPYIEIPYDFRNSEIIQKVVVGPCPHPIEAADAVHQFLKQNINNNFEVVSSKIPYRFW